MTQKQDPEEKIQQLLDDFKDNIRIYEEFCTLNVKPLLEKLLDDANIKAQAVTARAKGYLSYEQKIRNRFEAGQSTKKYNEIRDLAGCRVIFYREDDLAAFVDVVRGQFDIVHSKQEINEEGYNATHLTIRLNEERAALPEYKKFEGLLCEIQFTTVLAHAWSEQNHDLIYKDQDQLKKFDPQGYEALDTELKAIMKEHLVPATRRFGIVQKKAERIRQGQKVFNTDYLSSIPSIDNNNVMYDNLKLLESFVKEFDVDNTPDDVNIIDLLNDAIKKSKENKVEEEKSIFGTIPGKKQTDIILVVLDILDQLRYRRFDEVFPLMQKYSRHENADIQKKALESLIQLAKYNYHVIKQVGYEFQERLIEKIKNIPMEDLLKTPEVYVKLLEELVDTSFDGSSFNPKTHSVTIHQGALGVNESLKTIRKSALEVLFGMFDTSDNFEIHESIISAVQNATRLPHTGEYSEELKGFTEESANQIIEFFIKHAPSSPLALLLDMEEEVIWQRKRFKDENLTRLNDFIAILEANEDYQIYRILAGYPGRLTVDVDDLEKEKQLREEKADEFIASIEEANKDIWQKRIINIANNHEPSGRRLLYFEEFLVKLGKLKPELILEFIKDKEEELGDYLNFLLKGVLETEFKAQALELIDDWIEHSKNLTQSVFSIWQIPVDLKRLENIFDKALAINDQPALIALLRLTFMNYTSLNSVEAKKIIFGITEKMDRKRYRHWLEFVWYSKESLDKFMDDLDDNELDSVLKSFMESDVMDHHYVDALASIAKKHPQKVMHFFKDRVLHKRNRRSQEEAYFRYDAIPYHLDDLGQELKNHPDEVIPELMSWLSDENHLLRWETAHFFANLYPTLEEPLTSYLEKVVESNDSTKIEKIVLPVLQEYHGQEFIHSICKKIVEKFGNKYDNSLFIALSQTGVVSGPYGFVEAYKRKQAEVEPWLEDENSKVKAFAKRYIAMLELRIKSEKKRADDDEALFEAGLS